MINIYKLFLSIYVSEIFQYKHIKNYKKIFFKFRYLIIIINLSRSSVIKNDYTKILIIINNVTIFSFVIMI